MDAPLEIRGPYKPIPTNVPGIQISEHAPRLARMMDKLVPIRSMWGSPTGAHDSFICYTGRAPNPAGGAAPTGAQSDHPSFGSVVSALQGQADPAIPAFVGLAPKAGHPPYGSPGHPGYMGPAHSAFRPNGAGVEDLKLNNVSVRPPGRPAAPCSRASINSAAMWTTAVWWRAWTLSINKPSTC